MNESIDAARRAIEREEYEEASRLLRPLAEAGVSEAQYLVGYLYFTSADVDAQESRLWLERAAAQQHPEALLHLSRWRAEGIFGPPGDEPHRALLIQAAELGSIQAQRDLGCCYATGEDGWPLDPFLGRIWYGRAAKNGHADAQYNYGLMLLLVEGGPVDPSGQEWVELAAAQNDAGALHYLKSVTG